MDFPYEPSKFESVLNNSLNISM